MGRRRGPSPEDKALWRRAMKDVVPLPHVDAAPVEPPKAPADPAAKPPKPQPPPPPPRPHAPLPPLAPGQAPGVDRATARRVRQGRLPIEARLDLHGMGQVDAHHALNGFVRRCQDRGKRLVLVITGTGSMRPGSGVLRNQLPRWLNEPQLRDRVLSLETARPEHGGAGAFYLLLRRRRDR